MARITNQDTLPFVESRYELGMLGAQRVRDLNGGATPLVEIGKDKPTVTALREIATGKLDMGELKHEMIQSYKTNFTPADISDAIESQSESPELKELAAELDGPVMEDMVTEEDPINDEIGAEFVDDVAQSGDMAKE